MISTIITAVLIGIAVLTIGLNVLAGFLGKNSKALSKLVVIAISFIIALICAKPITKFAAGKLLSVVENALAKSMDGGNIGEVLPSFDSIASAFIVMIVTPILFVVLFSVVRFIVSICFKRVFTGIFDRAHSFFRKQKHYFGPLIGLVTGALILVIFFVPISGFINIASDAAEAIDQEEITAIVDVAAENPTIKATTALGGKAIFNSLTSVELEGHKTNLNKETGSLIGMVNGITELVGDKKFSEFGAEESETIRGISESFGDSVIVPALAADILSSASGAWNEGEAFMGNDAPSMGDAFGDFTTDLYGILATTDYDTVRKDVDCLTFVLCQFIDYGVFATEGSEEMLDAMAQEGLVSGIVEKLYEYDRMASLIPSITNVGFYMLSDALGIPKDNQEIYDTLMTDIAEQVSKAKQAGGDLNAQAEALKAGLIEAYGDNGIDIPEETVSIIAPALLGYFDENGNINASDISAFYGELDKALADKTPSENGVAFDGVVMISKSAKSDFLAEIADYLLFGSSTGGALNGYDMVINYVPNMDAVAKVRKLSSSETMESAKVTLAMLRVTADNLPTDVATKAQDAKNIEKLMSKMTELKGIDTSSIDSVIGQIGTLLDSMSGMSSIGHETTNKFLTAVLQSDSVTEATGWTPIEAVEISTKLSENAQKNEGGYEQIMTGVGSGVAYINVALDEAKTMEERREALRDLLININEGTVDSVESVLTPSLLIKNGASEENMSIDSTINAINVVFANTLEAKQSGMPENEYLQEVDAIDTLMMIALSGSKSSSGKYFGEGGSTGMTSRETVDLVVDSVVVSNSIVEICYEGETLKNNPLEIKNTNGEEMESLRADLVNCYNERIGSFAAGSAEAIHFTKTLNGFAAFMNLEPIA